MAGSWPVTSMFDAERGLAVDEHLVAEPVDERRRSPRPAATVVGRDLPEVGAEVAIGAMTVLGTAGGDEGDAGVGRDGRR